MNKQTTIIIALLLIVATPVLAVQPTQQYNKIYLNPFYRDTMTQNTNYTYTVSTQTPDGISQIKSAIITLDAWINPTRTFYAWMNNNPCNTASYTVSTTYASAGRAVLTFDCSNAIMPNKENTVTLRVTGGNIGASTAWLDLTYMNNPVGELKLHGTEYIAGDDGKLFLQFLDADYKPVNNSECFLSLWFPNSTKLYNSTLMSYLDEGIYYKNFLVPDTEGVYPASAKCYRPVKFANIIYYNYTYDNFESNSWTGGVNWSICPLGDPDCQNGWDYDPALTTIVSNATAGTGGCFGAIGYCVKMQGSYGFFERGFPEMFLEGTKAYNISFRYKTSGFQTNEEAEVYIFDGNWHLIYQINLLTGRVNDRWYNVSVYIDDSEFNLDTVMLGFFAYDMPSGQDIVYVDDVYVDYIAGNITLTNETDYQVLRGSGEVHVSKLYGQLNQSIYQIPNLTWNYSTRNLTYYMNFTQIQVDNTNYSRINMEVPEYVWNYSTRNLTYYQNFTQPQINYTQPQVDLTNYSLINEGVWNYTTRNLTYYENFTQPQVDLTNYSRINEEVSVYVWNYSTRNLTYYENFTQAQIDLTNYSRINEDIPIYVWNYTTRNLTYYENFTQPQINYTQPQVDLTNYSLINEGVWNYTDRNLTYYPPAFIDYGQVATNVWNHTTRNLTYYENFTEPQINFTQPQVDLTNYSRINEEAPIYVWNYTTRNLTYYENFTQPQINFTQPQQDLTNYSLINEGVWNYTTRNLTYYENFTQPQINFTQPQTDLTNYSRINEEAPIYVWNYTTRNLTYYENFTQPQINFTQPQQDLTNYSLVSEGVWNYTTRNLTYYENFTQPQINFTQPQVDLTNYTRIDETIYAVNQSLYQKIIDEADLVISTILLLYENLPSYVWNYTTRNLTYYENFTQPQINYTQPQIDLTNYTLIATSVWEYTTRNLTFYEPLNTTTISNDVWNYPVRNLTYYPTPDYILQADYNWNATARYTHGVII